MENLSSKMPLWGPYSKKYMGISHIVKSLADKGARFDFIMHPTIWNSSVPVPNVTFPSSYHLWHCKPDYSFYSFRYELMWKDMIYADVSFSKMDEDSYLVRCDFVNNTDLSQNCILNAYSSLEFPKPLYCKVSIPDGAKLVDANDYLEYTYKNPRPWDNENPDGMAKGQFADYRFHNAFGLGDRCENYHVPVLNLKPFGAEKGDKVSYALPKNDLKNPVITFRYRTTSNDDAKFLLGEKEVTFKASNELALLTTEFDYSENITLLSLGNGGIEFDFFVLSEKDDASKITTTLEKYGFTPEVKTEDVGQGKRFSLFYPESKETYYVLTNNERTRERKITSGCLEDALVNRLSNGDHTYDDLMETFSGSFERKKSDEGFFHNALIQSIFIEPHSNHTEYMVVSMKKPTPLSNDEYEEIYKNASKYDLAEYNENGKKYSLSTEILKSTLLTNVVYPLYKHGENIVHFTPGKRWDSFYTWDSGVIACGVLEYSTEKSKYILETYLSDEDNKDFDFTLHGSLVPTQFVQYLELLKKSNDKDELLALYSKMMRYYNYLAGKIDGSSTGKFQNGLLTTYDYWYSCSGMDDYPAQVYMINKQMMDRICPTISTSHIIRAAKIMKMVATELGKDEDVKILNADIERSSNALNNLTWDEESGYYSYTVYDKNKNVVDFLRNENGENMNKGMDGVYPLVAGVAKNDRKEKVLAHIKNPKEMWSKSGISAVDMSASYYFNDGYWNGNVWMSHQWFLWKTMFDLGDTDFAFEIANRALNMWKAETDFSYNTYECFGIETQRGGWFHNFGGLSAPVCIWADTYYRPGTITTGLDMWTKYQKADENSAETEFKYFGENDKYSIVVCLSDKNDYEVYLDGKKIDFYLRQKGIVEITLDGSVKSGKLSVKAI